MSIEEDVRVMATADELVDWLREHTRHGLCRSNDVLQKQIGFACACELRKGVIRIVRLPVEKTRGINQPALIVIMGTCESDRAAWLDKALTTLAATASQPE